MNILLILREEIVCLVLLLYLLVYSVFLSKNIDMSRFKRLCLTAITHVTFDIITVNTVNAKDLPYTLNLCLHLIFYLSAMFYAVFLLEYAVDKCIGKAKAKMFLYISYVVCIIYAIVAANIGLEIHVGNGTLYSYGPTVYLAYAIASICVFVSWLVWLLNRKKADKAFIKAFVPISIVAVAIMSFQAIVPEMLFTGASVTIVTVGLFLAIENPAHAYMKKAYTDVSTGVKSRMAFDEDFERYENRHTSSRKIAMRFGIVLCDLNGLKTVNDTMGHDVGDKFIKASVDVMKEKMISAKEIYRVGGDEFVAIYLGDTCDNMLSEIKMTEDACIQKKYCYKFDLSIAMGCAEAEEGRSLKDTYKEADIRMYERKIQLKEIEDSQRN